MREWNAAARNTFGYSADDAIGQSLPELLVPPALRERYGRMIAGAAGSSDNPLLDRPIEAMAMHASGAEFPIELSVSMISSDPLMFTGFVRDISERRRREQANERLTALVDSSQDAIVSLDLDEVVTGWSERRHHPLRLLRGGGARQAFRGADRHPGRPRRQPRRARQRR